MKPYIHAESSAKKYGGKPEDYIEIHNFFDSSKAFVPSWIHRALYHHTAGIFLAERIFGVVITNSDGKKVSVRDVGEQHVMEDFQNKFIPTPQDYLQTATLENWMNGNGYPPSYKNIKINEKEFDPSDFMFDGSQIHIKKENDPIKISNPNILTPFLNPPMPNVTITD